MICQPVRNEVEILQPKVPPRAETGFAGQDIRACKTKRRGDAFS
jgi:hypothetical protein